MPLGVYHDKGTDSGDTWMETNFDDSSWEQGPTQLGYGNDGEKTVLDQGPALLKRTQPIISGIALN